MPLLIVLGIIVAIIAVAIFKVNQRQSEEYYRLVEQTREVQDTDDEEDTGNDDTQKNDRNK